MAVIRILIVFSIGLAGCGGAAANPCDAIAELEALHERFKSGDIATALDDLDREALTESLDAAGEDAAILRDELEAAGASPALVEAAGLYARGFNLMDATFSAETIRQDDLVGAMDNIAQGLFALQDAKAETECD